MTRSGHLFSSFFRAVSLLLHKIDCLLIILEQNWTIVLLIFLGAVLSLVHVAEAVESGLQAPSVEALLVDCGVQLRILLGCLKLQLLLQLVRNRVVLLVLVLEQIEVPNYFFEYFCVGDLDSRLRQLEWFTGRCKLRGKQITTTLSTIPVLRCLRPRTILHLLHLLD